ncbi:MAG: hypothetical protein ACM31L_16905 [Actinomycetota bacterium]
MIRHRIASAVARARTWTLAARREAKIALPRKRAMAVLAELGNGRPPLVDGPVLVDGSFDNSLYWARIGLVRGALGLNRPDADLTGLLGAVRQKQVSRIFGQLGIRGVIRHESLMPDEAEVADLAADLLRGTSSPEDVLEWKLPFDYPACYVYDNIIKRQRRGSVDLRDANLPAALRHSLRCILAADRLVGSKPWSMMLLSHAINALDGPIAWRAAQKGIPVMVVFGMYGLLGMVKIGVPNWFDIMRRAVPEELDAMPAAQAEALAAVGRRYVQLRQQGSTVDLAARFAYGKETGTTDRAEIAAQFGWDPKKPIVGVFSSCFFDYPHCFNMSNFRDFIDWLEVTLTVAREVPDVQWLVRAHPAEQWYGGECLAERFPAWEAPNVRLALPGWNGAAVQASVDALITMHGTVGVEAPLNGMPVMVADRGWYHDIGFVYAPESRQAYMDALRRRWWEGLMTPAVDRRAHLFAGMHFGGPDWQRGFVLPDDAEKDDAYKHMPRLFTKYRDVVEREMDEIVAWHQSGQSYYHPFKMMRAEGFVPSNIARD